MGKGKSCELGKARMYDGGDSAKLEGGCRE